MGAGELAGAGCGPGGLQGVPGFHLEGLPERETAAQLGRAGRKPVPVSEPRRGSRSRILEAYGESNNNLLGDKDSLKNLFLPQVKTAMVINGEFLVSVSSGLALPRPRG